jgi:hypothetical protein
MDRGKRRKAKDKKGNKDFRDSRRLVRRPPPFLLSLQSLSSLLESEK